VSTHHREFGYPLAYTDTEHKSGHRTIAFLVYLLTHGRRSRALGL